MSQNIPSFIMVIFGATGDLTKRKLIPSLFSLYTMNLLPEQFQIFAYARRPFSDKSFCETLVPFIKDASEKWASFCEHIQYVQGNFTAHTDFEQLRDIVRGYEEEHGECLSKLYYMATSPDDLPMIVQNIGEVGLHIGCGEEGKWTRVIIEKPFGHDLQSAQELNAHLLRYFKEEQLYRIDHYLGKETVQNILSVRFANLLFKAVWKAENIDHIQITAAEELGVEDRGGYYDHAGALRDMVQSHLLQVLALVTMNEPERYDAETVREEKNRILSSLHPIISEKLQDDTVRGQYTSHSSNKKSYINVDKVENNSTTETFVALKVTIDLSQWNSVPIYIRTGKALRTRSTQIHIVFKKSEGKVFSNLFCELRSNIVSIQLQPNEGISIVTLIKEPGFGMKLQDVPLNYAYSESFKRLPDAYERLLMDCMLGDQTLFTRTDEIESSWRFITGILNGWKEQGVAPVKYEIGSEGPIEAEALITRDGRKWIE